MDKRIVIISEKPMASERIAQCLGRYLGEEVERRTFRYGDVEVDFFTLGTINVVPLEGHLVEPEQKRIRGNYPKFEWTLKEPRGERSKDERRRKARWELIKRLVEISDIVIGATDNDEERLCGNLDFRIAP